MLVYIIVLTVFSVYIISSFVFLRKPHFIHKRRRPAFIARNIAHRGGAAESIENTLVAFDTRRPAFIARNIAHRGGAAESIENTLVAFDTYA
ncbi:unnamed protein product [Rotaria sp. Silwood1]|nr:unnamed protein product [Rotaria sp. Silwood1]